MPNPIRIEERYQELHAELESAISIRYSHALVAGFLRELEGEYSRFSTYVVQISEKLKPYEGPLTWSGLDPKTLESQIALFEHVAARLGENRSHTLCRVSNQLKAVCLLLYGCLEERGAADRFLKALIGRSLVTNEGLKGDISLLKEIDRQIRVAEKETREVRWIKEQLLELLSKKKACLLIPVAELYRGSYPREFGRLRCLQVELFGEAEDNDELAREYRFIGAEEPIEDPENEALKAARNLFEKRRPGVHAPPFRGAARYELSGGFHDGRSSDLAVAGLWYTSMEEATARRIRFALNPHAAVTGRLNREGKVETVDEETIRLKAQAAFFSWAEMLVVPSAQKRVFESHLSHLKKSYPGRNLFLMEAENLNDLFYDRRVAPLKIESRIGYALRRAKEIRYRAVGVPLVIFLLLVIARLYYGPIDRNASFVEYEGTQLLVKNGNGMLLTALEVGLPTVDYQNIGSTAELYPLATLVDLNRDGLNELIHAVRVEKGYDGLPSIQAWSVSGDSLIWERSISFNHVYPRQPAFVNRGLRAAEIQLQQTESGSKVLLNSSLIQYFQSVLFTIDARTGEIEQEYLHPGRIEDILAVDVDNDEEDEILFTGVNNAYWNAMAGLLEYEDAGGYAPATEDYIPANMEPARESRYLMLKKTVLAKYFETIWKYNIGQSIHYDELSEQLYITVVEGTSRFSEFEKDIRVLYYLDRNLKPIGVGTSDLYDIKVRRLFENGEIPVEPDFDYFEALRDSILYWTGEEFVPTQEYFKNGR